MTTIIPPTGHHPPPEPLPPIFRLPLRPLPCIKWFWHDIVYPYGILFFALAALAWHYFTPDFAAMATLKPGWMAAIWLRNVILLCLVAGGLHWWLYIKRAQGGEFKYDRRPPATGNRAFLWGDQVRDNIFWSVASGSVIWSAFEIVSLWLYASGRVPTRSWGESPLYLSAMAVVVFFWGSLHFYLIHRALHWRPLYKIAHELHHRNVNIGPWSGISMHPLEHLLYFSPVVIWWLIPADPIIIIAAGFFAGIGPAFSHAGYEKIRLGKRITIPSGTWHHQLHHRYFEVNYGNPRAPLDEVFGTWHNGSDESHAEFLARRKA